MVIDATTLFTHMRGMAVFRYRITDCEVVWAVKDASIVSTFVDAGAAKFFLPSLSVEAAPVEGPSKRPRYTLTGISHSAFLFLYFCKIFLNCLMHCNSRGCCIFGLHDTM